MKDDEKILDEYIEINFMDEQCDCFERKIIADTIGFRVFCLNKALEELRNSIKHSFPFNLFF